MYVRFLRDFFHPTYGPCLNKRAIAGDTVMHEAYKEAQERGTLPFNRTKVLILGDHAAGKTSTCRRLQGKSFRQDEPSTIGIETKYAKANISDVNSKWHEVGLSHTPLNDNEHEQSAAWWAVSHLKKQKETETKRTGNTPRINKVSVGHLFQNMFHEFFPIIPICILYTLFGGFTFGFGVIVWIYISCLMLMINVHWAYRIGSSYMVGTVLIDSAMSINECSTELNDFKFDFWNDMSTAAIIFMYSVVAFLNGIHLGTGCRTGVCVALCVMVHPKQKIFTIENATESLLHTYSKECFTLKMCIVVGTTMIIHRYVQAKIMSMRRNNYILTLISTNVFIAAVACIGRRYCLGILSSLCFSVIPFFTTVGVTLGKEFLVYGYIPPIYIMKNFIGFIAGICIGHFCGWELPDLEISTGSDVQFAIPRYFFNLFVFVAPVTAYVVYEFVAYKQVKNTTAIPIEHVRNSLEASMRDESYLDARFSIWDFAGQEIYYNTHHLFMPKQGVYLILFNAIEAALNSEKQLKRLKFWLQSVAMHAEAENVVVLLVGTRRESVNALLSFVRLAHNHLYKLFSKFLAFHPSGSLFFFIENTLQVDKELDILREVIYNELQKLNFFHKRFLIKYLLFNKSLNKFRLLKRIITSLQDISEEVKSTCDVISQNELIQFLNYFDRSGDVIYNGRDELLRNYVICDPQVLVDILTILVNVPDVQKRDRTVTDFWQILEDTGIVNSRLLEHICRVKGIWKHYPYIIRFLVGTHLLFPLSVNDEVDQVGTFFLSCGLPKINLISNIWNINDNMQDVFYFDLGGYLPEFIFLRLIAKCCEMFTWDKIYYNAARFRITNSCLFLINTHVFSGGVNLHDRNFIKVSVHNEDPTLVMRVLQEMLTFIKEIINRDFNTDFKEQYICGPVCERCSLLDNTKCLVNLIVPDNNVSILDGYRPDQYHQVTLNPKFSFMCYRTMNDQV